MCTGWCLAFCMLCTRCLILFVGFSLVAAKVANSSKIQIFAYHSWFILPSATLL